MGNAVMIVLVFIAIGPLIGLATLSASLTLVSAANIDVKDAGDSAAFGAFIFIYGVLFAHFFGALWAAVAGALVALRSTLWGPGSVLEAVPIGVLTALASIVTWNLDEIDGSELDRIQASAMAGWILVHVVPTMACIALTRRWQNRDANVT